MLACLNIFVNKKGQKIVDFWKKWAIIKVSQNYVYIYYGERR